MTSGKFNRKTKAILNQDIDRRYDLNRLLLKARLSLRKTPNTDLQKLYDIAKTLYDKDLV